MFVCVCVRLPESKRCSKKIAKKKKERDIQRENDRLGFLILNGKLIKRIDAVEEERDGRLERQSHTQCGGGQRMQANK